MIMEPSMKRSLALVALVALSATAHADVPPSFSVQGVLRNKLGQLQSTAVTVTVYVFDVENGGQPLAGPYALSAQASNGLFSVTVSDSQLIAKLSKSTTGELWIGMTIANDTFPRQRLTPTLMALMCGSADHVADAQLGQITVLHNAGGTGDAVNVPFDQPTAMSLIGKSFVWSGGGPKLRDVQYCHLGSTIDYKVDSPGGNPAWPGQYTMTVVTCLTGACLTGSWEGASLKLYDDKDVLVTDATGSHGDVHFTLAWEGAWRVEHMSGMVGIKPFECH
jgi:hypothetical protein